jgi:UDP-N-acetylmuramate dehydrogenase
VNTPKYSLKPFNTFGFEVFCSEIYTVFNKENLFELYRNGIFNTEIKILSGGSNVLLTQNINVPVILNRMNGIHIQKETSEHVYLNFGAGESWHDSVMYAVNHNWGGMENLSLIPGCMGAAPIQNIGAYGVELKDIFYELEAFNLKTGAWETFNNEACQFGYRDSVFKGKHKGSYFITSVCLKLSKNPEIRTQYGDIQAVLDARKLTSVSIADVSSAIIQIRKSKLPDPAEIGNSGSFFKNPVISNHQLAAIQKQYPDVKSFPQNEVESKIPAAWLIEKSGWKGYRRGQIGVHEKQALVLVHYGGAQGSEVALLASEIQTDVQKKFGISLEFEVNIW